MTYFFLKVPRSGGEPGIFWIFRLFSLKSSALDHSATAPPLDLVLHQELGRLKVVHVQEGQSSHLSGDGGYIESTS